VAVLLITAVQNADIPRDKLRLKVMTARLLSCSEHVFHQEYTSYAQGEHRAWRAPGAGNLLKEKSIRRGSAHEDRLSTIVNRNHAARARVDRVLAFPSPRTPFC
jgi:hypothetical protein